MSMGRPISRTTHWDDAVADYEMYPENLSGQFADEAIAMVGEVDPRTNVLDVAAGTGLLRIAAARTGAHVLATDNSPAMVARLSERLAEYPGCSARIMDGQALEVHDGFFRRRVVLLWNLRVRRFSPRTARTPPSAAAGWTGVRAYAARSAWRLAKPRVAPMPKSLLLLCSRSPPMRRCVPPVSPMSLFALSSRPGRSHRSTRSRRISIAFSFRIRPTSASGKHNATYSSPHLSGRRVSTSRPAEPWKFRP